MSSSTSPGDEGDPIPYFDNPCETFTRLRKCYEELVSGQQVSRTEYHGNGQERHLEFSIGSASRLKELMDAAYDACSAQQGGAPRRRRFAITAGSYQRRGY